MMNLKNTYYRQKHQPSIIWHTLVITSANTIRKQHLPEHKNKNQHNIHDSGITSTTHKNSTKKIGDWTSATIGKNISLNFQPQVMGKTFYQTTSENYECTHFLWSWEAMLDNQGKLDCNTEYFCFQRNLNLVHWKTFYILFSYLAVIVSHIYDL